MCPVNRKFISIHRISVVVLMYAYTTDGIHIGPTCRPPSYLVIHSSMATHAGNKMVECTVLLRRNQRLHLHMQLGIRPWDLLTSERPARVRTPSHEMDDNHTCSDATNDLRFDTEQ